MDALLCPGSALVKLTAFSTFLYSDTAAGAHVSLPPLAWQREGQPCHPPLDKASVDVTWGGQSEEPGGSAARPWTEWTARSSLWGTGQRWDPCAPGWRWLLDTSVSRNRQPVTAVKA